MAEKQDKPATIGFRLTAAQHALLVAAAERSRVSPHEYARERVIRSLEGNGELRLADCRVTQATQEIQQLRVDLAVILEAVLIATRVFEPAEARRFVTEKLVQ
jgi:hypothetical protein